MLILAAQNLNNFRFQTHMLFAMRVVCIKCSEDNFQVASFKPEPEQVVNKEAKDAIQAGLEKNEVLSDKTENYSSLHFKKEGVMGLLSTRETARSTLTSSINGRGCCHNFIQLEEVGFIPTFSTPETVS